MALIHAWPPFSCDTPDYAHGAFGAAQRARRAGGRTWTLDRDGKPWWKSL